MGYPALFVAILAMSIMLLHGTPSSLNPDKFRLQGDTTRLVSTVHAVALDIAWYESTFQKKINNNAWYDELKSQDAIVPKSTEYREWSMGSSPSGRYLCIHVPGSPTSYQVELLKKTQQTLDFTSVLNEFCGDEVNWDGVSPVSGLSLSVYIKG